MYEAALRAEACDPFRNLAVEESLLERGIGSRGGGSPGGSRLESAVLVYVNEPCVVIGRNQNPWIEVSASAEIAVLRRVSGGGAVYHDRGNLNWSIIAPRSRHDREAELALVAAAIRRLGVETVSSPRGGLFVAGDGPWGGAKVSGSARRLSSARVLHHGTLLVDADLGRLTSSLGGIQAEATKALPSVRSRSVNLSSLVPGLEVEEAADAIARELSGAAMAGAEELADLDYAGEAARRLGSWEWTWGSTPAFSVALTWSGGRALVEVRGGRVASASGQGAELLSGFAGDRFTYGFPAAAVLALEGGLAPREQES